MGRITSDEKGVNGIGVALMPGEYGPTGYKAVARASSDAEGYYRLTNIAPGRYRVVPFAPAFIISGIDGWPPGKVVTLGAGETVENMDFTITRGGVITGRVINADDQPVIGEQVHITSADSGNQRGAAISYSGGTETDDRGIYRIYGLPAGRYRVSVGQDQENNYGRIGGGGYYARTFYPGTSIESEAKLVEVTPGGEATDIDITLGKRGKTFKVAGRFVNAETGQPVPDLSYGYGALLKNPNHIGGMNLGSASNARGEFTIEGVAPGRYGVFAAPRDQTDWYSDVATFVISDADVAGIEVKVHHGGSISGTVVIEGINDRAKIASLLPQVAIYAYSTEQNSTVNIPMFNPNPVAADGSFRLSGLRAGRFGINSTPWRPSLKGLTLVRVEREGVEVRGNQIELAEGAQVTGVRVVLAYGAGIVRGQVIIKNGDQPGVLPEGIRLLAFVRRVGALTQNRRPTEVDARGRFMIEDLPAGDYEIMLRPTAATRSEPSRQQVAVPEAGDVSVTMTFDLSNINESGGRP